MESQRNKGIINDVTEDSSMGNNNNTVIYGYCGDYKSPEETEKRVLGLGKSPLMKRYKGVWRKKSGKWVARTRDQITNVRVMLGTFDSAASARKAYFSKRLQFEAKLRASEIEKQKHHFTISSDIFSSVVIDNHGHLLGEFSRLDDDLRICD